MTTDTKTQILQAEKAVEELVIAMRNHANGAKLADAARAALVGAAQKISSAQATLERGVTTQVETSRKLSGAVGELDVLQSSISAMVTRASDVSTSFSRAAETAVDRLGALSGSIRSAQETSQDTVQKLNRMACAQADALERFDSLSKRAVDAMEAASRTFTTGAAEHTYKVERLVADVQQATGAATHAMQTSLGEAAQRIDMLSAKFAENAGTAAKTLSSAGEDLERLEERLLARLTTLDGAARGQARMQRWLIVSNGALVAFAALLALRG